MNKIKKCPLCNKELVDIYYGMPSLETVKLVEEKKAYLGGCEILIDKPQPKYHCYNCNKDFYKDLEEDEI